MFFSDAFTPWANLQKSEVIRACETYKSTGLWSTFLKPTNMFLAKGNGGAYTTEGAIVFKMAYVENPLVFFSVALHEIAHIVDMRNNNLSIQKKWLAASGWNCTNFSDLNSCEHVCKQTEINKFHCDSSIFETLPSRYGTSEYNSTKTDVSINPAEDFAEASRYYLQANDALTNTSKSRCDYFRKMYRNLKDNPCFDCNISTLCKDK